MAPLSRSREWGRWPLDRNPASFESNTFAVNAVLGGVLVGWATLMYFATAKQFAVGDTRLVDPMLISVAAWFIVDSIGSLLAGLPGNVVLNVGFLGLFLPPLLALRRSDDRTARPNRTHGG